MKSQTALRSIMFVGTGSDVGKSVITAGFCRIFRQDGYAPAPFKAQNMSLNSYATPDGLEIGRAQAVQAEAAGIPCHVDMNPLLLKPVSDSNAQVILGGKPIGNQSAREYFLSGKRDTLFAEVKNAYDRLSARYSPIVMEGAGSISELNLKHLDITNMRMAIAARAATYLIADIDRGGVFGSLYGTMQLLDEKERACIKGIIINKFRGDEKLFESGRTMLEDLCGVPVLGVIPFFRDILIDEEDSVSLAHRQSSPVPGKVNIAVILLEHLSNFTDFNYLRQDTRINLFYTCDTAAILKSDIIILPGSKNTIEDLLELKKNGIASAIVEAHGRGRSVIGICGGYQMMGEWLEDPLMIESDKGSVAGLALLPVSTVLQTTKTTRQRTFAFRDLTGTCKGYEIHMGVTSVTDGSSAPITCIDGEPEGYYRSERCWGSYLHGILDNPSVIDALVAPYTSMPGLHSSHSSFKEEQYDRLAALIRRHIDMSLIYKTLQS